MSDANLTVKNAAAVAPKADIHLGGTSYRLPRAALASIAKPAAPKAEIHVGGTSYRLPRAALARVTKSAAMNAG